MVWHPKMELGPLELGFWHPKTGLGSLRLDLGIPKHRWEPQGGGLAGIPKQIGEPQGWGLASGQARPQLPARDEAQKSSIPPHFPAPGGLMQVSLTLTTGTLKLA